MNCMENIKNQIDFHNPKTCMSQEAMNNLYEMRVNNILCDSIIKLDDGTHLNVHRAILGSCSNYFRALFTTSISSNSESNLGKNIVYIPEIKSDIMKKIIDYAYLRKCHLTEENVYEIFIISDYVEILGLVRLCAEFMKRMLRPQNCVNLWLFSRSRFSYDLSDVCHSFILCYFTQVAELSEELLKLELNDFYDIISNETLNTKDEEPVWECCLNWIEYDPSQRIKYIPKLMEGVRLGLLNINYFMENVKNHPYVISCEQAHPIVMDTITFLYDLEMVYTNDEEIVTPNLALPRLPHEIIFAHGGWHEGQPQSYIETYDTRADRWIRVLEEDPDGPRAYHGMISIGYKLYCIGGFNGRVHFNTCRVFDAVKKEWGEISPMHFRRCYVAVTILNGFIYAMGGYDGHSRLKTAERYDPETNQWTLISEMNFPRSDADACTLNGLIYIVGGFTGQECLRSGEYYDPNTNTWFPIPNMASRRSGVSCVAYKGNIFAIGGYNGLTRVNSGERYDPILQTWTQICPMYNPRSNFGIEIIDDMIFVFGGFNGILTIPHTECYINETNEWLEATDLGRFRSGLAACNIKGLPNVKDYIYKNRESLLEERKRRMVISDIQSNE